MPFYPNYLRVPYYFGQEQKNPTTFPNLVAYSDIWEEIGIADETAFYLSYYIKEGMRPDNVSFELYNSTDYSWTFFYLNTKLREQGWPLDSQELLERAKFDFPNTVVTTKGDIFDNFKVRSTVNGQTSNKSGVIIKRNVDLGQIYLEGSVALLDSEGLETTEDDTIKTITIESVDSEYNAVHHYSDATNEYVDIDPNVGPGALLTKTTMLQHYEEMNDNLRNIKVLKPEVMRQVIKEFKRVMK